jgi:hypothetical protein
MGGIMARTGGGTQSEPRTSFRLLPDCQTFAGEPEKDPILGMFSDDPGLVDEIVEEALKIREERPWRLPPGES